MHRGCPCEASLSSRPLCTPRDQLLSTTARLSESPPVHASPARKAGKTPPADHPAPSTHITQRQSHHSTAGQQEPTPHTQRCTKLATGLRTAGYAHSARAEMHRPTSPSPCLNACPLRTRRDEPAGKTTLLRAMLSTLHTQRCTDRAGQRVGDSQAHSARAEIHRSASPSHTTGTSPVRTRGEVPMYRASSSQTTPGTSGRRTKIKSPKRFASECPGLLHNLSRSLFAQCHATEPTDRLKRAFRSTFT